MITVRYINPCLWEIRIDERSILVLHQIDDDIYRALAKLTALGVF